MDRTGEINYEELFGVNLSEEPEAADPEDANQNFTGENEPEGADPAGEDPDAPDGAADPEEEREPQSREENAKYAAARRRAEQERDAAIEQVRRQQKQEIDEIISGLGLTDQTTGKKVETKEDYDRYREQLSTDAAEKVKKRAGMTDEQWNELIESQPEMKQARQAIRQAQEARARQAVNEQVQAIAQINPDIATLQDLSKLPEYGEMVKKVQAGMSLLDAYKITTYNTQRTATAAGARQAAINNARGKEHLRRTTERGSGEESVPKDVLEMYRLMNPTATDAEIRKHWNRQKRRE